LRHDGYVARGFLRAYKFFAPGRFMTHTGLIEFNGTVTAHLAAEKFRVRFDNGHEIVAYTQDNHPADAAPLNLGMRVTVEIANDDFGSNGLVFRRKVYNV